MPSISLVSVIWQPRRELSRSSAARSSMSSSLWGRGEGGDERGGEFGNVRRHGDKLFGRLLEHVKVRLVDVDVAGGAGQRRLTGAWVGGVGWGVEGGEGGCLDTHTHTHAPSRSMP